MSGVPGPAYETEDLETETPPSTDVDRVAFVETPYDLGPVCRTRPVSLVPRDRDVPAHLCTEVPCDALGRLEFVATVHTPVDLVTGRSADTVALDTTTSTPVDPRASPPHLGPSHSLGPPPTLSAGR